MNDCAHIIIFIFSFLYSFLIFGQVNYDQRLVPKYLLPEALRAENGKKIESPDEWQRIRRPEIISLFENNMYGKVPEFDYDVSYINGFIDNAALNNKAIQKEIIIRVENEKGTLDINILIFLPKNVEGQIPLFFGMNFEGNQTINLNSNISITKNLVSNNEELGVSNNKANENTRGISASRWPLNLILERGYGLATVYYGDIDPDFDDGFKNGIHALAGENRDLNSWGSIASWAWGLSRAMDYFELDEAINENQIALIGHSRLGKATLWAGAQDQRFALVISNDSGCGGAALSRRKFGETIQVINNQFPHWFSEKFRMYNNRETQLPIDQHMLLSLIAPRPIYVASAIDDQWADPRGEYLSLYYSGEVYELFGNKSLESDKMPETDVPEISDKQGYHIRTGGHDLTSFDWEQFLNFMDIQKGLKR